MSTLRDLADALTVEAVLVSCGVQPPRRGERIPCPIHKGEGRNFGIDPANVCLWRCFSRECGSEARRDGVNLLGYLRYGASLKALPRARKADLLRSCEELTGLHLDKSETEEQYQKTKLGGMTDRDARTIARLFLNPNGLKTVDVDELETVAGKMAMLWMQCAVSLGKKIDKRDLESYIENKGWTNGVS